MIFRYFILIIFFFSLVSCGSYYRSDIFQKKYTQWKSDETEDFNIFYKENSLASKDSLLSEILQNSWKKAQQKAKIFPKNQKKFHLYIVDNAKEIKELDGELFNGLTYSKSNTIIQVYEMRFRTHEFNHLLMIQHFGKSKTWLQEGAAVWSDSLYRKMEINALAHYLWKKSKTISIADLMNNRKFSKQKSAYTYPQAGSLVLYIIKKFGYEKFTEVWQKKSIKSLNISVEQLEKDWLDYIKTFSTEKINYPY